MKFERKRNNYPRTWLPKRIEYSQIPSYRILGNFPPLSRCNNLDSYSDKVNRHRNIFILVIDKEISCLMLLNRRIYSLLLCTELRKYLWTAFMNEEEMRERKGKNGWKRKENKAPKCNIYLCFPRCWFKQ